MKRQLVKFALVCSVLVVSACQKSNDNIPGTSNTNVTGGVWSVTLFSDSGNDETSDFSGYSFVFNSDGSLNAARSGTSKTGTWGQR